jgi:hypothetical protein
MSTITTKDGTQIYYKDWAVAHQDQINADLLAFIKGERYHVANS